MTGVDGVQDVERAEQEAAAARAEAENEARAAAQARDEQQVSA